MVLDRNLDKIKHKKTQIVAEDRFKAQNIECRYIPTRILFNHQEKTCIENERNKAQKNKPFLFDGKLFHIQNQKLAGFKDNFFNVYLQF